MVRKFLDNKDNIQQGTGLEQLTLGVVSFSTTISPHASPTVYLQAADLYCLFLNSFPAVQAETSLDFVLSAEVLAENNHNKLLDTALKLIKDGALLWGELEEVTILNGLLQNLPEYMGAVGLAKTTEVIKIYCQIHGTSIDINISKLG